MQYSRGHLLSLAPNTPGGAVGLLLILLPLALILAGCGGAAQPTPGPGVTPAAAVATVEEVPHPVTPVAGGFEEVTFATADGVRLAGRVFGKGSLGVVLSHMYPADQESWGPFAETLAKEGYMVLTFNFRGYRPSGGAKEIEKLNQDVEAALELLRGRGAQKVFLIGASMGGTASVQAAARQPVAGLITLSAPTEFRGLDAAAVVAQVEQPKLFIAAEGDKPANQSAARLFQLSTQPRIMQVFQGSEHGTDMLYGKFGSYVQQAILEFLAGDRQ
ncbi:MAG: alpha/beta hydrolase [Chloroflexi bacterium]|nr:alpha/beta hydrolase [Chloroflexota bacterium]